MATPFVEFRGVDFMSALNGASAPEGLRIDVVSGFLAPPDARGDDYIVAARAGRSVGNRVADVLKIIASGEVRARTPSTWRTLTDSLLAACAEGGQDPGTLTVRGPHLGLTEGQVATIAARVKNLIEGPIRAGGRLQTWSIEFESIDPAWNVAS